MQVRRTNSLDELAALAGDWNEIAGRMPFRSHQWLSTWWQHYQPAMIASGRHVDLYMLCVQDGGKLVGLAPCYAERSRTAGRIVRLLGTGEVCSDYLGVLARPEHEAQVAEALADWLTVAAESAGADDDRWDILSLAGVDAGDTFPALLANRLSERGAGIYTRATESTWRIELPDSWDGYLDLLSKSHRKQLRQLQRRMFATGRATLRTAEDADQVDQGWRILTHLHQRRLQSLGKAGAFQSAAFSRFHRAVTAAMFEAGVLRLHWVELDGRPIAAEYQLAGDNVVFAYQGGIEPDALRREPGRLAMLATLEQAINAGYRAFDFCRGDEPYKAHWRAAPRASVEWRIVSNRSLPRLRHSVWIARENARRWVRHGLTAAGLHHK